MQLSMNDNHPYLMTCRWMTSCWASSFCCYPACHYTECHGAILESTKLISFKKFPLQADRFKLSLKALWNLWLCHASTVVKHSTQNAKVKASNPATGARREKISQNCYEIWLCRASTVVKHSTQNAKVKASNHATGTGREKYQSFMKYMIVPCQHWG